MGIFFFDDKNGKACQLINRNEKIYCGNYIGNEYRSMYSTIYRLPYLYLEKKKVYSMFPLRHQPFWILIGNLDKIFSFQKMQFYSLVKQNKNLFVAFNIWTYHTYHIHTTIIYKYLMEMQRKN